MKTYKNPENLQFSEEDHHQNKMGRNCIIKTFYCPFDHPKACMSNSLSFHVLDLLYAHSFFSLFTFNFMRGFFDIFLRSCLLIYSVKNWPSHAVPALLKWKNEKKLQKENMSKCCPDFDL